MRVIPCQKFLFILLFLAGLGIASAQSTHEEIEALLNSKAVTLGQLARMALDAAELPDASSYEKAFNLAKEKNWLPENAVTDDLARMDTAAFLLMKAFDLKGGLFYSLTCSNASSLARHYAYRELVNMRVIQGRTTPNGAVSGEQLLFMTSRLLSKSETAAEGNQ